MCHSVGRFWSHTPNSLLSEVHAVVPSTQMSGRRARNVAFDDVGDRLTQRFSANVTVEHTAQIRDAFTTVAIGYPFEAGIGAESVQAQ
jgi:hypothetical protein